VESRITSFHVVPLYVGLNQNAILNSLQLAGHPGVYETEPLFIFKYFPKGPPEAIETAEVLLTVE
jgi:hypothetical protein